MATAAVEEIEIIETPPQAEETAEAKKPAPAATVEDDDPDDEPGEDPRGHEDPNATDADREALRARRRQEKEERKVRKEAAIRFAQRDRAELAELRRELSEMRARQDQYGQRAVQAEMQGIEGGIAEAQQQFNMAKEVAAKAIAAGNGDDAVQAMDYRDRAAERLRQLTAMKQQFAAPPQQQRQQGEIDPQVKRLASQFVDENKAWYDPKGGNEDSMIMLAIDRQVLNEGFNPATEEYWTELRKRATRRLPERFTAEPAKREARGGPALGSGRGEGAPGKTQFYVSPERKKAMVDGGYWDDPVKRNAMIKSYMEYDKNNPRK